MDEKQIRNFFSEAKTKIELEMLKEELIITQLSAKYKVVDTTIQNWRR
jgi:hypothetical protein